MKSKKTLVWILVAAVLALCAIGVYFVTTTDLFSNDEIGTDLVTFELSVTVGGEEVIWNEEVSVTEGTTLIDAMTANITEDGGVVCTDGGYGAYITSICGYSENYETNEYWVYTVNGESIMEGASVYCPEDGDEVVFDLSPLVW